MDFAMRPAVEADLDEIYVIEHASFGSTAWPNQMQATEPAPHPNTTGGLGPRCPPR